MRHPVINCLDQVLLFHKITFSNISRLRLTMGSNGSSQMAKPPIHIVNLEELLFTFVKRKILKRRKRERLCLGLTMYLEVLERTDSCDASEIVTASIVKMSLSSYSAVRSVVLLVSSPLLLKLHCGITYGSKNDFNNS